MYKESADEHRAAPVHAAKSKSVVLNTAHPPESEEESWLPCET